MTRRARLEELASYEVGTVLTTLDGAPAWRKCGPRKTDWEKVVPHPSSESGWRAAVPADRHAFTALTKVIQREPMVVWTAWEGA